MLGLHAKGAHARRARCSTKDAAIVLALVGGTVLRVALACATPVVATVAHYYDDQMMMRAALSLVRGEWLGAPAMMTLAKNPGYPLFVALGSSLGLSYQLALASLTAASAASFAVAIRPVLPSRATRTAIYLFLLWTPALFTARFFQRAYRMGLPIPVVTVVFSCYLALYFRRGRPIRELVPWAALGGVAGALFWLVNESGGWVVPFVAVCSATTMGCWALDCRRRRIGAASLVGRALVLSLPVLVTVAAVTAVCALNHRHYGIWALNNNYQGAYARFKGLMVDMDSSAIPEDDATLGVPEVALPSPEMMAIVDQSVGDLDVWVTRKALAKALSVSPTLASMSEETWRNWLAWIVYEDEIVQDLGFWGLRDAYDEAYGWDDLVEAERYWDTVCDELERAYDDGRLSRRSGLHISGAVKPVPFEAIPFWLRRSVSYTVRLGLCDALIQDRIGEASWDPSGPVELQHETARLLGGNVVCEDDPPEVVASRWSITATDRVICRVLVAVQRAAFVSLLPVLVAAVIVGRRCHDQRLVGVVLATSGLLLSAFALVAGITWTYISFPFTQIYGYAAALYPLVMMAEALVLGYLLTLLRERRAQREREG